MIWFRPRREIFAEMSGVCKGFVKYCLIVNDLNKMTYMHSPKAFLLSIGRELLCGWTRDSDGPFLAKKLTALGIKIERLWTVDDEEKAIVEAIRDSLRRKPAYLFTTGGLGPTFDDMTLRCVAKALRRPMRLHAQALAQVQAYYREMKKRGVLKSSAMSPARRKMAILPKGGEPLPNPCGGAPGVLLQERKTRIYCLPGVPPEMKGIFRDSILPVLRRELRTDAGELHIPFRTKDESTMVPAVARAMRRFPRVYIKTRVRGAGAGIRIVATLHGPKHDLPKAAAILKLPQG